jgi:hypothetical protein
MRLIGRVVTVTALLVLVSCGSSVDERSARPPHRTGSTVAAPLASSTTTTARAAFELSVAPIEGTVRARVEGSSWRPGCPVPLEDLRYVRASIWGFDGAPHVGEVIVHADVVDAVGRALHTLYDERFPIRSLRLVDDFGADDFSSIEADNSSAFNCRKRTDSGDEWSQHSYGRAIDINPIENPYVSTTGTTAHATSRPYLDRTVVRPGMVTAGDSVVQAFAAVGWEWGGTWSGAVDLQHFSRDNR